MYAKLSKIYYTPRKLRLVANLVKGMKTDDAMEFLRNVKRKGAIFVYKTIKSAVSNAAHKGINQSDLVISDIRVDQSVVLKRYFAESRGRVRQKLKRYSTLIVKLK